MDNKLDPNIWRKLDFTLPNGYRPVVPRRWVFVGTSCGQQCRFAVELTKRVRPGYYRLRALFARNVPFVPDCARLVDLQPI